MSEGFQTTCPGQVQPIQDNTADHAASQAGFLQLSNDSHQLFANKSGHEIHIDQPEAATAAILKMVEQIRK